MSSSETPILEEPSVVANADPVTSFLTLLFSHGVSRAVSSHPIIAISFIVISFLPYGLYSYLVQQSQTTSRKPPYGLDICRTSISPDEVSRAKSAPKSNAIWQVGVSSRAVSIAEDGVLRCIEFTESGSIPKSADIISAIFSAILSPIENKMQPKLPSLRPAVVSLLQTRQCDEAEVDKLIKAFAEYDLEVRVDREEVLEPEMMELKRKWNLELLEKSKNGPKKEYAPQPPRICFHCRKEIGPGGKVTQCSACKAVIFCGADCAKKDWPNHKNICKMWKATMQRVTEENLHDLPFTYYNKTKQLQSYNTALFLSNSNVHNRGVFRRLCHCFDNEPFGELGAQLDQIEDPNARFLELGVPNEMHPLNKAVPNPEKIDSWKKYYDVKGIPFDSPIALALESPLTLFHLINKFLIPKLDALKENEIRKLTIHMIACTYEADIIHLYEVLVGLLPNTELTIHLFGPAISQRIEASETKYSFSNAEIKSKLIITIRHGGYTEQHLMGQGEGLNGVKPNLIVCLNAPIIGPQSQMVPWKLMVECDVKCLLTTNIEASVMVLETGLMQKTGGRFAYGEKTSVNPFRQPVQEFAQDLNLPSWSNGFELHVYLSTLKQDDGVVDSIQAYKDQLMNPLLLDHKDKNIKSLTACCLADMLRLYAPDAPYSRKELETIFDFFISQIGNLANINNPFFQNYFYLVENLSNVKSICLIFDLNRSNELIENVFKKVLDTTRPEHSKNLYMAFVDILQQIVDEAQYIPKPIIDMLMETFRTKKTAANASQRQMVVDLFRVMTDKLQRYVSQYFTELLISISEKPDDDDEEEESNQSNELEVAHKMILEIFKVSPGILLSVIPQLDEELRTEKLEIRVCAVQTLGKMFSQRGSRLAMTYPSVWNSWLERLNDKVVNVRILVVDAICEILKTNQELASAVCAVLKTKLMDPDEKVRFAIMKMMRNIDLQTANYCPIEFLKEVGERGRDKRVLVRNEAIRAISRLFNLAYPEMIKGEEIFEYGQYSWIPSLIFDLFYIDDQDLKSTIFKALHEEIFPPINDDSTRTDRLLFVYSGFETDRLRKAFKSVFFKQSKIIVIVESFLNVCEKYNGGIMDDQDELKQTKLVLEKFITAISTQMPDPLKANGSLRKFADNNERRLYQLLRGCMNGDSDYKTVLKNRKEVIKKLDSQKDLQELMANLLGQTAYLILNKTNIAFLIARSRLVKALNDDAKEASASQSFSQSLGASQSLNGNSAAVVLSDEMARKLGSAAESVIMVAAECLPQVMTGHVQDFKDVIFNETDQALVTDTLAALSQFCGKFSLSVLEDRESRDRLVSLVLDGTPLQAEYATLIVCHLAYSTDAANEIVEKIVATLQDDPPNLLAHLKALAQIAKYKMEAFDVRHIAIVNFLVNLIVSPVEDGDPTVEWVEFDELTDSGKLKIYAIQVLVNRLLSLDPTVAQNETKEISKPTFKLLRRILDSEGRLKDSGLNIPALNSHLRLCAGQSLLKLCRGNQELLKEDSSRLQFYEMLSSSYQAKLALMMQDPIYQVRNAFAETLVQLLQARELPAQFVMFLVLGAHEPEAELKNKVKSFLKKLAITGRKSSKSGLNIEKHFSYLLHLLGLHPDFSDTMEDLQLFQKYIEFFLESVGTSENVSYLYFVSAQLKAYVDNNSSPENLYVLCDLSQILIMELCNHHQWVLQPYPEAITVSKSIFKKLADDEGTKNIRRSYLPVEFVNSKNIEDQVKLKKIEASETTKKRGRAGTRSPSVSRGQSESEEETDKKPKKRKSGGVGTRAAKSKKERTDDEHESDDDEEDMDKKPLPKVETPSRRTPSRTAKSKIVLKEVDSEDEMDEDNDMPVLKLKDISKPGKKPVIRELKKSPVKKIQSTRGRKGKKKEEDMESEKMRIDEPQEEENIAPSATRKSTREKSKK
ncbi:hypothetical protein HK098_007461 [Nowakowskiella sp. JEL0407]|nr:hypothetical protein HK098_007461 [Nowakowskiella sp. JEL0407]